VPARGAQVPTVRLGGLGGKPPRFPRTRCAASWPSEPSRRGLRTCDAQPSEIQSSWRSRLVCSSHPVRRPQSPTAAAAPAPASGR
jgi:hypothetical protein